MKTKFVYNDGGRAAAGYTGKAGDCAVRAIAIATGMPYQQAYDRINEIATGERTGKRKRGKSSARNGVYRGSFHKLMAELGWQWVPTMQIGSGCKVHLDADELPSGRLIVNLSKHYAAVIDGVVHDTHDPNERGATIYPPHTPQHQLPKGAKWLENGNGWAYEPLRCVYGYWRNPTAP